MKTNLKPIYLIVSEDDFLVDQKVKTLLEKHSDYETVKYDLKETSLENVLEDLNTYNFLISHKMIIAFNASFLTAEGSKESEEVLESFSKYLDNPNLENTLILVCSKLDERKKIVKKTISHAVTLEIEMNIEAFVKGILENYEMSNDTIQYLIEFCRGNYEKIKNELEKLKLYCYDEKKITKSDIDAIVERTIDDNIFNLVEAIVTKNKKTAFEIYEELLKHNEEPIKILILVANQFRLLYQVKVLNKERRSESEIASLLGVHPYRVKLANQKSREYTEKELLLCLNKLADLDSDIKQGKTFQNVGFELFVLNL